MDELEKSILWHWDKWYLSWDSHNQLQFNNSQLFLFPSIQFSSAFIHLESCAADTVWGVTNVQIHSLLATLCFLATAAPVYSHVFFIWQSLCMFQYVWSLFSLERKNSGFHARQQVRWETMIRELSLKLIFHKEKCHLLLWMSKDASNLFNFHHKTALKCF